MTGPFTLSFEHITCHRAAVLLERAIVNVGQKNDFHLFCVTPAGPAHHVLCTGTPQVIALVLGFLASQGRTAGKRSRTGRAVGGKASWTVMSTGGTVHGQGRCGLNGCYLRWFAKRSAAGRCPGLPRTFSAPDAAAGNAPSTLATPTYAGVARPLLPDAGQVPAPGSSSQRCAHGIAAVSLLAIALLQTASALCEEVTQLHAASGPPRAAIPRMKSARHAVHRFVQSQPLSMRTARAVPRNVYRPDQALPADQGNTGQEERRAELA